MVRCVLIIDADQDERRWLEQAVSSFGYPAAAYGDATEAFAAIGGPGAPRIALALLGLEPASENAERSALTLLDQLGRLPDHPPMIALAPPDASDVVTRIMRAGAMDFVVKPISAERLEVSLANALKISALERELERSRRRAGGRLTFEDIAASSAGMKRVIALGRRAAALAVPILLEGEPGSGKESLARAIHGASAAAGGPFVCVNCAAIPPQRIEDELFGRGGAAARPAAGLAGKIGLARGGTLYLEEPGELPAGVQERLWKLLEAASAGILANFPAHALPCGPAEGRPGQRDGEPAGGDGGRPPRDVRLIAASSQDLITLARTGAFREDLYLRLNAFPIAIPPLRERMDDIPELIENFIARFSAEEGKRIDGVEPDVLELVRYYAWPGNVRQLENAVYRAVVLAEGSVLTVSEFPQIAAHVEGFAARTPPAPAFTPRAAFTGPAMIGAEFPLTQAIDLEGEEPGAGAARPAGRGGSRVLGIPALNEQGDVRPLDAVEADMIRLAVGHYKGHMTEVARRLGIGRSTLYRKLREIGVDAGAH